MWHFLPALLYLLYSLVVFVAEAFTFRWIRQFLWALLLIIVIRSIFLVLSPEFWNFGFKFWYYVLFGLLTYTIAFWGYQNLDRQLALHDIP